MGSWIKMRIDLQSDPAVISMAAQTGIDEYGIVGRLHAVWSWMDSQSLDGNAPGVTPAWLDRYTGVTGFSSAMEKVGWLVVTGDGLHLPNFDKHNGQTAKARALTAKRVNNHRGGGCNGESVTGTLPDKIREDIKDNTKGDPPGFLAFWEAYPRMRAVARAKSLSSWNREKCEDVVDVILNHIAEFKRSGNWDDVQFCPNSTTYLNQRRWETPPLPKGNHNGNANKVNGHNRSPADIRREQRTARECDENITL